MSDALASLQGELFAQAAAPPPAFSFVPDLGSYERILVAMSGKDSLACLLHLIELGAPRDRIELLHHDVDGGVDDGVPQSTLFDWPCTHAYIQALGDAFELPVTFSYREFGIEGELLRENSGSHPIVYFRRDGSKIRLPSARCKPSTRLKFPQQSASLTTRWCSWVAKIAACDRMLTDDPRFLEGKTLIVTGERAEESANRAKYAEFEPHRSDNRGGRVRRHIDAWRAVHKWSRADVWKIIERHAVLAHPAYYVGYGRASCFRCVFNNQDAWATSRALDPAGFDVVATYERRFGLTIHRSRSVVELADHGRPYDFEERWKRVAMSRDFHEPIFMDPWVMPIGALAEGCGPT